MQDDTQQEILGALLLALKPLTRALLQAGIGHREFTEISKTAFVETATKDYGLRGRPTNISRVAVMTGLTRKEVRRIRDKAASGKSAVVARTAPMAEILHRWYSDQQFLSTEGKPKDLKFDGGDVSFAGLVKKYGGDIPPGAMRTELKRIKAIEELSNGKLRVLKRNVSGLDVYERLVNGLATTLYPAASTIAHNLKAESGKTWIMRSASTKYVRKEDIGRLRRTTSARLAEFVESVDDLFSAYESIYEADQETDQSRAVGVGVFYFEEDKSESDIFS